MKFKGSIQLARTQGSGMHERDSECVHITIQDRSSGVQFVDLRMTIESFGEMLLGRCSLENCSFEVRGTEFVGKVKDHKEIIIPMPAKVAWANRAAVAESIGNKMLSDGWMISDTFGSQGSFYTDGGKEYARAHVVRYVDQKPDDLQAQKGKP